MNIRSVIVASALVLFFLGAFLYRPVGGKGPFVRAGIGSLYSSQSSVNEVSAMRLSAMATFIPKMSIAAHVDMQESSQPSIEVKAMRRMLVHPRHAAKMRRGNRRPWKPPAPKSGNLHHHFRPTPTVKQPPPPPC